MYVSLCSSLTHVSCLCVLVLLPPPEDLGKPGSDAGMPGIEDSEVGKIDEVHFGESAGL